MKAFTLSLSPLDAVFREGKTNFDSTYQRNNPSCFIVWDNLHKVKIAEGRTGLGMRILTSFF